MVGVQRLPTRNDPIHGHIPINHVYQALLPLQSIRQLKYKLQLGFVVEVYDAAEHSRYVHSRGTGYVARKMGEAENVRHYLSDHDRDYLQVAGLIHDITHYPFSHAPERAVPISHEQALIHVLNGRDFGEVNAQELFEAFTKLDIDPKRLLKIFQGQDILSQFISNKVLDADKLDYIPRDLHIAKLGMVETQYVVDELAFRDGKLGVLNGASTNITALIANRAHGFERMYAHKKVHAGETQLVYALEHDPEFITLRTANEEEQYKACSQLHSMGERDLLRKLAQSDNELSRKLGTLLLGTAEGWYKAVARRGHASQVSELEALLSNEKAIRAECLENGLLCSGFQARRSLKTRTEPLPAFPIWTDECEENFLEREEEARAAYQHIPGYAFVIYAEEDTPKARNTAEAILTKHS